MSQHAKTKTPVHFRFWNLPLDAYLRWVILVSVISLSAATYDICVDDEAGAYLACQTQFADIIWYQKFNLTVWPDNATCGKPASTYKRLGDRTGVVQTCDAASPSLQHPASSMVDESRTTWWQSINQPASSKDLRINITLAFNKTFILASDIIITFNSGRPEQMVLEKSTDYGVTWRALQYYARNCSIFSSELVPGAAVSVSDPTAVTCTNRFVEVVTRPPVNQTVKFPVEDRFSLFLGPHGADFLTFYTALENKMLGFLTFTDLRLRLIQPATDGRGNYEAYYYGIADLQIPAWCDCNLHAAYCNYTETGVVCDCLHNTMGRDCQACLPLYNERPWKRGSYLPFDTGTANECTKCECNEHAVSCAYNATYGRGICEGCLDNTRGYHCQQCVDTYYPNVSLPLSDLHICIDCDCDLIGVLNNSRTCSQVDNPPIAIGQCPCRPQVSGRRCDECIPGYYGLKDGPSPGNCTACNCTTDGTVGQSNLCQQSGGQCPCKPHTVGRVCDVCVDGYFSFPTGRPQMDCVPCDCDKGGSTGPGCDKTSGQCSCRANITGVKCNQVTAGNFVPMLDTLALEPSPGGCEVTSDLYTLQNPFDGVGFAVCNVSSGNVSVGLETIAGGMIQKGVQWPFIAAVRYSTSRSDIAGRLRVQVTGNTQVDASILSARLGPNDSPACPFPVDTSYQVSVALPPGQSTASLSRLNNVTLDIRCRYSVTLELYHHVNVNASGNSTTNATAPGDTTTNATASGNSTTNLTANGNAPTNGAANGDSATNGTANGNTTSNITANGMSIRKKREVFLDSGPPVTIDSVVLLPGLSSADGAVAFQSYAKSENQTEMQESYLSCLQQVAALSTRQKALEQSPCKDLLFSLEAELYDGARACACNPDGTAVTLGVSPCQGLGGQCSCQPGVSDRTCDRCAPGYFNFTSNGCKPCPTLPCDIPDPPPTTTTPPPPHQQTTTIASNSTGEAPPETTTIASNSTRESPPEITTIANNSTEESPPEITTIASNSTGESPPEITTIASNSTGESPPETTIASNSTEKIPPVTTTIASNTTEKDNATVASGGTSHDEPLAAGFIALIIIAAVVFVIIFAVAVWFVCRKVKRTKRTPNEIYHIPRCHLATPPNVDNTDVVQKRLRPDVLEENCSFQKAQPASPAVIELEVCSYAASGKESNPFANHCVNNNGPNGQKSHFHTFYSLEDVPLSQSSPKQGSHLLPDPSAGGNRDSVLGKLHRQSSYGGNLYDPEYFSTDHNQNRIRSKSFNELPAAERIIQASPESLQHHGNNLRKWMPKSDLRMSDLDRDTARDNKDRASSTDPSGLRPKIDSQGHDNASNVHDKARNELHLQENPLEKNKRKSPQKPVRQKQPDGEESSLLNKILPPPPMYDNIALDSFTDPDYDSMDDMRVLISQPGDKSLRGAHNPVFIPEPDYPSYADFTSFDEINGSLV